jgi:hypothetical protein
MLFEDFMAAIKPHAKVPTRTGNDSVTDQPVTTLAHKRGVAFAVVHLDLPDGKEKLFLVGNPDIPRKDGYVVLNDCDECEEACIQLVMLDNTAVLIRSKNPLTYENSSTSGNAKRVHDFFITDTDTRFTVGNIKGMLFVGSYDHVTILNQSDIDIFTRMEVQRRECEVEKNHLARLVRGVMIQRDTTGRDCTLIATTTMVGK